MKPTSIASGECVLSFSADKYRIKKQKNIEIANLDHPIFDWIKWTIKETPVKASGCSAITMQPCADVKKGSYIYYIQKWRKEGVEKSNELKYFVISVNDNEILDNTTSEMIMNTAITKASSLVNSIIRLSNFEPYFNAAKILINYAWEKFEEFETEYKRKSKYIYNKQIDFINFTADKRIESVKGIIEKLKNEGKKQSVIYMNEKRMDKINKERDLKLKELQTSQFNEPSLQDLAIGVLILE